MKIDPLFLSFQTKNPKQRFVMFILRITVVFLACLAAVYGACPSAGCNEPGEPSPTKKPTSKPTIRQIPMPSFKPTPKPFITIPGQTAKPIGIQPAVIGLKPTRKPTLKPRPTKKPTPKPSKKPAIVFKPIGVKPIGIQPIAIQPVVIQPIGVKPIAIKPIAFEPIGIDVPNP